LTLAVRTDFHSLNHGRCRIGVHGRASDCTSPRTSPSYSLCVGYVRGFADGLITRENWPPSNVTTTQLVDVSVRYLRNHPEIRHTAVNALLLKAFNEAWPRTAAATPAFPVETRPTVPTDAQPTAVPESTTLSSSIKVVVSKVYESCEIQLVPNGEEDPDWCFATWVDTNNINHSQFTLEFDTTCVAYDTSGHVLGSGDNRFGSRNRYHPHPVENSRKIDAIAPYGHHSNGRWSIVRIEKVDFHEVANVTCSATNVAKWPRIR